MSEPSREETPLQIRCPACSQRFKVGVDLRERMVECGACEHRFQITDDVIVRHKKFYPGERESPVLSRFKRVPMASGMNPGSFYQSAPDPTTFEPVAPQRIIAGIFGVTGMILMALLLMFGAGRGAILDGMPTSNRLVMAGFTGLLGFVLLMYANPRSRSKAAVVGILMSGGLILLPVFFTEGSQPLAGNGTGPDDALPPSSEIIGEDDMEALRDKFGTKPLDDEIIGSAALGVTSKTWGLWLEGLLESNRLTVRDYLLRVTGADPSSHIYPRDGGNYLMVITGLEMSLEELMLISSSLGKPGALHPEIHVAEIRVDNAVFVEGPIEKLTNKNDPAFYELNKRELEAIELTRVSRAVQRLAEAEPKVYRADITRRLLTLLDERGVDFQGDVARALMTWSSEPGVAGSAAAVTIKRLFDMGSEIPKDLMLLAVKQKSAEVIPILDELWFKSPTNWETIYAEMGPLIEPAVIRRFPDTSGPLRQSAVRLLGKVGGADSVTVLKAAKAGADTELSVLIQQALEAIAARG